MADDAKPRGFFSRLLDNDIAYSFFTTPTAVAAAAVALVAIGAALLAPLIAPFDPFDPANVSSLVCWLASENSGEVSGQIFSAAGGFISVVEGYNRGPEMLHDRRLTFDDIDSALPELVRTARVRTTAIESHPYTKFG